MSGISRRPDANGYISLPYCTTEYYIIASVGNANVAISDNYNWSTTYTQTYVTIEYYK